MVSAIAAIVGLAIRQLTGSPTPDRVARALIGLLLIVASVFLLSTNRELLTRRGVAPSTLSAMRAIVAAQPGVVAVADLFAVVVDPLSLVVDREVTCQSGLDVSGVEQVVGHAVAALRVEAGGGKWPSGRPSTGRSPSESSLKG